MGSEAKRTKSGTGKATILHLCEDNIIDILLRLPGKSIYRCRAVCKAWHSATTAPEFLAAHSRRQQAQVVLHTYQAVTLVNNRASPATMALDLLPVSSDDDDGAGRRQRLIRCRRNFKRVGSCLLLSSCNGVLLFKRPDRSYILCNPATRKFAEIPRVPRRYLGLRFTFELVLYFHKPSDEYKLLCRFGSTMNQPNWWYVLSTDGSAENLQRQQIADRRIAEASNRIDALLEGAAPVDLHGRLHWLASPQISSNAVETSSEMVVFEAESETFHVMAGLPRPNNKHVKLFCMDGLLAAADFGVENHIDLWFLEDYDAGRWECRHHVAMPWHPEPSSSSRLLTPHNYSCLLRGATAADGEGNVMLGNNTCLVVYNVRTMAVRRVDSVATPDKNDVFVSRHVFKETLVPHRRFRPRSSAELRFVYFWH
jgi:F-box interacting protein